MHAHQNYAILAAQFGKRSLFVKNIFAPVIGLECSYGKIFFSVAEISVVETKILVTLRARLLIWINRSFYKGNRTEARSQKLGQPGQPGSYEEALSEVNSSNN